MNLLTEDECREWLSRRIQEPFAGSAVEEAYRCSITYMIPSDSGRKTALARALSSVLNVEGEGLLWITGWSVFPSSENMALFLGYRRLVGDERSVHAAPGHLFAQGDLQTVECLLDLILYFFWDSDVFDSRSLWLRVSHDESVTINARDQEALGSVEEVLSEYGLRELSRSTY